MRALVIICLAVFAGAAGATTVYRWVDENGVVHYSDEARPGAEVVELSSPQTFTPPPVPQTTSRGQNDEETPSYSLFEFAEPIEDKVYWNIEGNLGTRLRLDPSLRAGHSIYLYLDGRRVDNLPRRSLSMTVPEVYRGTHTMTASIADNEGAVVATTDTVTFHVRQTSVQNPVNPVTPPNPSNTPNPGSPPAPPTPPGGGN